MKRFVLFVFILLLCGALIGCGQAKEDNPAQTEQEQQNMTENEIPDEQEGNVAKTEYPLTIIDATGEELVFERAPEKIISMAPSETEVLFALGLEERIVGVTEYCDYPAEAASKPKIGDAYGNVEAMLAAEPDLIVAGLSLNQSTLEKLEGLDVKVFTAEIETLDEAIERILTLGKITDTGEKAQEIVDKMQTERAEVFEVVNTIQEEDIKSVYIEFSEGWTVGKGTFIDDIVREAGAVNVADAEGWYEVNGEVIIEKDPDVIFFSENVPGLDEAIKNRSGWSEMSAIASDAVIGLDDNLLSRPGPRITQALAEMTNKLYPDIVK